MDIGHVLGRQGERLADAGAYSVNSAALIFAVVGQTEAAAPAASSAFAAALGPPGHYLFLLQVPDDPSSNPSVPHGKSIRLLPFNPSRGSLASFAHSATETVKKIAAHKH